MIAKYTLFCQDEAGGRKRFLQTIFCTVSQKPTDKEKIPRTLPKNGRERENFGKMAIVMEGFAF